MYCIDYIQAPYTCIICTNAPNADCGTASYRTGSCGASIGSSYACTACTGASNYQCSTTQYRQGTCGGNPVPSFTCPACSTAPDAVCAGSTYICRTGIERSRSFHRIHHLRSLSSFYPLILPLDYIHAIRPVKHQ